MHRRVTLDQVQEVLRARVCEHCRLRDPGKPGDRLDPSKPLSCEATCELFTHLPELGALANQLDPMLRSYDVALGHRISQLITSIRESGGGEGRGGRGSPLNRHRRCVIETLSELVDGSRGASGRRGIPYAATSAPEK